MVARGSGAARALAAPGRVVAVVVVRGGRELVGQVTDGTTVPNSPSRSSAGRLVAARVAGRDVARREHVRIDAGRDREGRRLALAEVAGAVALLGLGGVGAAGERRAVERREGAGDPDRRRDGAYGRAGCAAPRRRPSPTRPDRRPRPSRPCRRRRRSRPTWRRCPASRAARWTASGRRSRRRRNGAGRRRPRGRACRRRPRRLARQPVVAAGARAEIEIVGPRVDRRGQRSRPAQSAVHVDPHRRAVVCRGDVAPGVGDDDAGGRRQLVLAALPEPEDEVPVEVSRSRYCASLRISVAVPRAAGGPDECLERQGGRGVQGRSVRNADRVVDAVQARRRVRVAVTAPAWPRVTPPV